MGFVCLFNCLHYLLMVPCPLSHTIYLEQYLLYLLNFPWGSSCIVLSLQMSFTVPLNQNSISYLVSLYHLSVVFASE